MLLLFVRGFADTWDKLVRKTSAFVLNEVERLLGSKVKSKDVMLQKARATPPNFLLALKTIVADQ